MGTGSSITVLVSSESGGQAALPRLGNLSAIQAVDADPDVLSRNLQRFLSSFQIVLAEQPREIAGYEIDEIELNLAVSASGGIELIGKLSTGLQAGIKVKLKRAG